ncbi:hypothetical protein RUM44_014035 [Polyplax serrata]|uniref:Uncharacterized protein n=1 Tax=Polyplax serrata TaxID=468196 RepID=A0ABR1BJW5_POLSC
MAQEMALSPKYDLPRIKSVERISKLPVVEQTVDMANSFYVRVKDTNTLVKSVLTTAETTVKGAVDMTLPVTAKLEGPIKVVDSFLCYSLDFVENKIPAVKLPLGEMYKNTRDSLYSIPGVKCACQAGEQGMKKAVEIAYGATLYGTQKMKDVKDCLSPASFNSDDPKSKFALQYSETVKQFFLLLISWVWMTKSHVSDAKPQTRTNKATNTSAVASSSGESSISHKKEREAIEGPKPNQVSSGASTGEEKENQQPGNHTKSE